MAGDPVAALGRLDRHRLLCAHREGPYGVERWGGLVEEWLREEIDGYGRDGRWYVGRPLLVTANDYQLRLFNGDTGVVVDDHGAPRAAFRRGGAVDVLPVSRLSDVQTVHAMSVHRSQGSQFDRVTLVLPPADSPLLTRELLYTAVTRAKDHVRVVGTPEAVAAAVTRPIARASGLRAR
jgi:exodeoxyribonuclease V alpha subunit